MTNVYFNFNGSFGIDATSNQHGTGIESTSSQCRVNVEPTSRDKLFLPHLWKHVAMIFAVLTLSIANIGVAWGAASTSSDGKTASGTITFSEVGTLSQQTTYWYNGLKFYEQSTNSMSADKGKRWSAAINPCQYGTFTSGVNWQAGAYEMTGLILQAHCLAINVSSACTIEIIVNMSGKTLGQSNPVVPGNLKVFWDGTEYGTAYTSSNYKTGTAKTDTTWEQNINSKYNRMKLSIPVSAEDLAAKSIDVIKVSYTGSATGTPGYSQAFVYESVKIVPAAACVAPDEVNVGVGDKWDYFAGETISLTATPVGGTGTPSYQWQKLLGSTWTNVSNGTSGGATTTGATSANLQITNCTKDNSGKYRCIVSTGATCSTASATKTDGTEGFGVKVFTLDCYNGGVTSYNFTRVGNTDAGTVTVDLAANTTYEFEVVGDDVYYGNTGTINKDETNWEMTSAAGHLHINSGLGGTFSFTMDYGTGGNNSTRGVPELSVTYPRKTIYLSPNNDWLSESAKFAFYYYGTSGTGWTDFLTSNDCGMSAEIPQWNGLKVIAVRLKSSTVTPGSWDDKWNQTGDITATADKNCVTITDWNAGTYGTYAVPTYTISYAAGSTTATGGAAISGSKASETKTCGVDFTLPSSAVFTATGYTQVGWTTTDGGAQTHALGGTYTTNAAQTFYPVWEVAASLTALECNTRYTVQDMTAGGCGTLSSTSCYSAGLSANNRFEVLGDPSLQGNNGGTPEQKTNTAQTINSISFNSFMYLKGDGLNGSTEPTCRGVKFIIPSAGKLTIYYRYGDRSKLKKEGEDAVNVGATTGGYGYDTHDVTAGTYYIYGASSGAVLIAVEYQCCTTPAAPTAFANTAVTSTTATFSITDAADAASYDLYYASGSPSTPTAGTNATENVTTKTPTITGLTASTTYKIWARSVCDASHKSSWVALGTTSFTTSAAEPDPLVHWTMNLNTATWGAASTSTTDGTNITSINTSRTDGGTGSSTSATAKVKMASAEVSDASNPSDYAAFTFTINAAKKVVPEKVTCEVFNVSTGNRTYKAQISDSNGHVYNSTNTVAVSTEATLTPATFTFASDLVLTGNVTVKVYAWKTSGSPTDFRMGADVKLFGEVQDADPIVPHSVTHSLTNVTATSGSTGAGAATEGVAYNAVFAASSGYVLPSTITVTIGGSPATVGTGYTWNASTGAFQVPAAQVTGDIVVTIAADVAPATKDIYYGQVKITDGALVKEIPSGTIQFFTNIGGTVANTTEISLTSTPSTTGMYYNSNNLTDAELSKSSNWSTSSGSNRYIRGLKFAKGTTYTLALGTKVASAITFYGWCGSASKVMTIGGEEYTSSASSNTFAKHEFTKSGGFTGNVSITQDGDFYGILVITIQTATPCTTPTLPTATLSDQGVCEGTDIAEWNATVTNASAISAAGETVVYSWKKKGNDTELANTATFDLGSSATESQAGTYVVTVTVSKTGYASSTATKEVTLSVTDGVEVTAITADKATVYPTNSVTLTATASATATWQWYTCTNAEGAGESSIDDATSASYTIASAPAAGTYYYKVKVTSSCGDAERVYALTVSQPSECEKYFWFVYAADATTNGVVNNRDGFFTGAPTGSSNSSTYKFTLDGTEYKATKNTGSGSFSISFTIPEGSTATMGINCKGSSSKPLYLTHSSGTPQKLVSNSSSNASCTVEDITEGTWTLTSVGSWTLAALGVQVCTTSTCTDATPTIAATNTTVCVGGALTITATGYETSPESIQWQKLNGSAWDNISGATAATYTVASATAADAGSYRVVVTKGCARTSNTVTIAVPSAPVFNSFTATRTVMATLALSISDVEASDATSYAWYKSADATYDAGTDTKVGTSKELLLASGGEAAGATYYLFCVASNACGSTTSSAITVNVTAFIEEDCATKGSESAAEFGFNYESGIGSGNAPNTSIPCWKSQGKAAYLTYTAPDGKYFSRVTMNVLVSSGNKAAYGYSTDGGTTWTYADLTGLTSSLADKSLTLPANVNAFRVGRNFDPSYGVTSGTFYLSKICFEYSNACTATTVTPSVASKTHTIGESFTAPTFTLDPAAVASETLTYSSSDEDIASVDESGNVTFNDKAGTVTITASYAGGTISETDYCASSGSYTITVKCSDEAPKIVPGGTVNIGGCNSTIALNATKQDGTTNFTDGTYQWFRNGEEIDGATGASYTVVQAGVYTVERTGTGGCTSVSSNSVTVTSDNVEPEITKLVPFHYYHVDKTYTDQMKDRHLFAVKNSSEYGSTGKNFKLELSRNGGAATDITTTASISVIKSADNTVDTVMIDLNKLSGKYSEGDELVVTCKAVDCGGNVSDTYKDNITIHVIGATPTLALICSGSSKASGTRKKSELTVGGDFLTGYNVADLCQQTGAESFDASVEWGLYTELKEQYIVTPVNGYANFNKLNYEPFDILLLTDYPKADKSDAAATVLDDMAALCDYRPMLSFKTHMVKKSPSKWAAKGFTTSPVVAKGDGKLNLNIVCYAHPMFDEIKGAGEDIYDDMSNESAPLVYTMLERAGYESSKGMQGFELAAAENFVTIGLTHYNATIAKNSPSAGQVTWTPGSEDRMLVTAAERQTNIEARFILFSLNCGAQSTLTDKGEKVILACLSYLLETDPLKVADCSFTFDNGESNEHDAAWYASECPGCTGTKGDGKWSTAANWGPDYRLLPGEYTSVRIKKPVEVDMTHAHVMEARIIEDGSITIPTGSALQVKSTIRRMEGTEIYPTDVNDIHIGSSEEGNGTLIFNNETGDAKAHVTLYSTAKADAGLSAAKSTWQYIGTPYSDVTNARNHYYDSWLYKYSEGDWVAIPNGGAMEAFRGYCVTHPAAPVYYSMGGTLVATTGHDIDILAGYTVIANSWVAPIYIKAITDDDMDGISDKSIYFFNTGSDPDKSGSVTANATGDARWAAGTYVSVPIHAASYTGDSLISSMQGFYIYTETAGSLHLDYNRHVRPTSSRNIVGGRMHAPKRVKAESNEPDVLKLIARGKNFDDRLIVMEREDFTRRYDSGWDGEAWGGSDLSPMVYITNEAGVDEAVSAIPEFEGTVITFRAGEDSEYRFEFTYNPATEPLYLFDTENNSYTEIVTGNAYYFTTSDKAPHKRFILTRNAPQIATGIEPTSDSSLKGRAKKLLIEDKLYILLNGMLYDATGKLVR